MRRAGTDGATDGIDTTIALDAMPGWTELEAAIGEPTDSRRLDSYVEFWRESLHRTRQDLDPVARQHGEDMWWAEADRALTSMLGPENGARVVRWMEEAFTRRTGGAS